ncbi:uncharacterized protein LOC115034899 [Acyrthosiphon pisum]|uniref:DUF4806 domain-containing protein n=1 Tax=Acyrthosiphon pisum TaxID=7029 RepID=A0A8R2NUD8_ACYPI|nr:uncharacterized protein LOC115034899 [Acyrthosiphon pisum]
MGSNDSPDLFALNNDVLHYLKPMNANNCEPLSQNTEHNQFTQINEDIHLNHQTSPIEKDFECLSQNTTTAYHQFAHHQNQQIPSATDNEFIDNDNVNMGKMLMFIGHVVKDVANDITEIKKSIKEIKVDIVKNQELLILLTDRANHSATQSQEKVPFRSNLKVPVSNLDDLRKLESNEEQKQNLAQLLIRNGKCFDTRRTTYEMMRILMENRVAESLNMAGRRGEKLPFERMDLYKILIDSVKYFFPEESVPLIKGCISDWLKQAPRRK